MPLDREELAARCLVAMLQGQPAAHHSFIAPKAVAHADALIRELSKPNSPKTEARKLDVVC